MAIRPTCAHVHRQAQIRIYVQYVYTYVPTPTPTHLNIPTLYWHHILTFPPVGLLSHTKLDQCCCTNPQWRDPVLHNHKVTTCYSMPIHHTEGTHLFMGWHTHTHAWGHNDTESPRPNKQLTQPETASGINDILTNMHVCMCAHAFA